MMSILDDAWQEMMRELLKGQQERIEEEMRRATDPRDYIRNGRTRTTQSRASGRSTILEEKREPFSIEIFVDAASRSIYPRMRQIYGLHAPRWSYVVNRVRNEISREKAKFDRRQEEEILQHRLTFHVRAGIPGPCVGIVDYERS